MGSIRVCLVWAACISLFVLSPPASAEQELIRANPERMEQRIIELSRFGANPEGGVSRVAFSNADIAAREWLKSEMRDLGLDVRVDAGGNVIGRRAGTEDSLPPIMLGSHIDSVPGGGNYDGDVGVIGAVEVMQLMNEHGIETRRPIEIVSFTDEEGGLSGSRAMIGHLGEETLGVVSHSGMTIREGLRVVGGDPDSLQSAARNPSELHAFLELHIEQGAFLDEAGIDIGVVEGIVGIRWWDVTVLGMANHAGTTPMNRRKDAMLAAAELTLAVNRVANDLEGRQVATVGRVEAFPGAPNVIPGRVEMSIEIRDLDADKMQRVFDLIQVEADRIAEARSISIQIAEVDVGIAPAPTDERMRSIIATAADSLGLSKQLMPSGAGHDAQDMATITPTGMIFVPSEGGISHSPEEFTSAEDMANGASVLLHAVLAIDAGALK